MAPVAFLPGRDRVRALWRAFRRLGRAAPAVRQSGPSRHYRRLHFTFAVVGLCAKLAAVDGTVSRAEFLAFRKLFPMENDSEATVARLFNEALEEKASPVAYAQRILRLFPHRVALRQEIFNRLLQLAAADGAISSQERAFLWQVAESFSIRRRDFDRMLRRYTSLRPKSSYEILGVTSKTPMDKVRRKYLHLIREYHPDGLEAYGFSAEEIATCEARLASINAAYTEICRQRGMIPARQ